MENILGIEIDEESVLGREIDMEFVLENEIDEESVLGRGSGSPNDRYGVRMGVLISVFLSVGYGESRDVCSIVLRGVDHGISALQRRELKNCN